MKNKKPLLIIGVLALVGIGGYLIYTKFFKKDDKKDESKGELPPSETPGGNTDTNTTTTPSKSGTSKIIQNPFKTKSDLENFQVWVVYVKGDKNILGNSGMAKDGVDGVWGDKTASAWAKYSSEWQIPKKV